MIRIIPCALCFGLTAAFAAATTHPALLLNGDFENTQPGLPKLPAKWQQDGTGPVYTLDTNVKQRGRQSMHIAFKDGMNKEGYAGIIQTIDVRRFAGRRLKLSAYIRRSSERLIAGIWAQTQDADQTKLNYQNSYDGPVGDINQWSKHNIIIDLPKSAATLKLGAAGYESDGEFWVDDIRLDDARKR